MIRRMPLLCRLGFHRWGPPAWPFAADRVQPRRECSRCDGWQWQNTKTGAWVNWYE